MPHSCLHSLPVRTSHVCRANFHMSTNETDNARAIQLSNTMLIEWRVTSRSFFSPFIQHDLKLLGESEMTVS